MPDRRPNSRQSAAAAGTPEPKACASCGRTIAWRKKWERDWGSVKFCSDACRARKIGAHENALEEAIVALLHERGRGKTICPSEAARKVAGEGTQSEDRSAWEPLMEPARAAARRLVAAGKIDITQAGHIVDGSTAKGPIRLRLR
jgi:hypothetical protein